MNASKAADRHLKNYIGRKNQSLPYREIDCRLYWWHEIKTQCAVTLAKAEI